jgi:dihydroorotate dehydrogenase electron transfer subunit
MPIQEIATIRYNHPLGRHYGRLGLTCSDAYRRAHPGQFVMLRLPGTVTPLLRRPFSIHRCLGSVPGRQAIEILYKIVGPVTARLAEARAGQRLDLLGPLGRGFMVPLECRRLFLAAGGVGVAPLLFLAETLGARSARIPTTVFLGGRSREDLLCAEELRRAGAEVVETTDDGSAGEQCLLTDPLAEAVRSSPPELICACGPIGMLRCVAGIAEQNGIACQVSLETAMACGIGVCLGCAVESRTPGAAYAHACVDGPVFDMRQLKL